MSSNWKYADIDAETRLSMLREGNEELFDEEVARTKEVVSARESAGLDTDAQRKWLDKVGYNYNLYTAKNAGEDTNKVSKEGYARLYLDKKPQKMVVDGRIKNVKSKNEENTALGEGYEIIEGAKELARTVLEEKYTKIKDEARKRLLDENEFLKEALVNSGASLEGGKAKKAKEKLEEMLKEIYGEYDKRFESEREALGRKYDTIAEEFTEKAGDVTQRSVLRSLANSLVSAVAEEDGYEFERLLEEGYLPEVTINDEEFDILYSMLTPSEKEQVERVIPRSDDAKLSEIASILYSRGKSSPEEISDGEEKKEEKKLSREEVLKVLIGALRGNN